MTLARQGGFTGPIINSYTCQSIQQFMVPAGEAAANVFTLVVAKDPSDPALRRRRGRAAVPRRCRARTAPASIRRSATSSPGTTPAFIVVDALTRAAAMEGGLTRANLMNAFWSFDLERPLAIGGVAKVDGVDRRLHLRVRRDGRVRPAATGYKVADGVEIDVEGEGGVFGG